MKSSAGAGWRAVNHLNQLNELDDRFGITDKLVSCLEHAQQEFVIKAKETGNELIDLGAMHADKMLEKGVRVVESEVKKYLRKKLEELIPRRF